MIPAKQQMNLIIILPQSPPPKKKIEEKLIKPKSDLSQYLKEPNQQSLVLSAAKSSEILQK